MEQYSQKFYEAKKKNKTSYKTVIKGLLTLRYTHCNEMLITVKINKIIDW